jgi:hypothetical protein
MRTTNAIALLALLAAIAFAQKEVIPLKYGGAQSFSDGLAAVMLDGKWGFIDKEGKEVVPPKYNEVKSFSDGLAAVKLEQNSKWGFIDKEGKEVVPPKYIEVEPFFDGLALVRLDGDFMLYGYINKTGKEIIPLKYDEAWSFSEGVALVMSVDKKGKRTSSFIDKTGKVKANVNKYFDGREAGDDARMNPFSDGMMVVYQVTVTPGGTSEKLGVLDKAGAVKVPFGKYDQINDFSDGLAAVVDPKTDLFGYIDKTNKLKIPHKYSGAWDFSEGLAVAILDGGNKKGIIDKAGKEVAPFTLEYSQMGSFSEGSVLVTKSGNINSEGCNGSCGYIDNTGKEIVSLKYAAAKPFKEGLAAVNLNGKWGFISQEADKKADAKGAAKAAAAKKN